MNTVTTTRQTTETHAPCTATSQQAYTMASYTIPTAPPLTAEVSMSRPPPMVNTYMSVQPVATPPPVTGSCYPPTMNAYPPVTGYPPVTMTTSYQDYQLDPVIQETLDKTEYEQKIREAGMSDYPISSTKYTYESTPVVNKLQIEPSPPVTSRPCGPVVRVKSAPRK